MSTRYRGWDGQHHDVGDHTLRRALAAMDVPAGTPEQIAESLAHQDDLPWRHMVPPTMVVMMGQERHIPVHVPHGDPVEVWITTEQGFDVDAPQLDIWVEPRVVNGRLIGRASFAVPTDLPLGWHTLHARSNDIHVQSTLAVTPRRLSTAEAIADRRRWGLIAQLYAVRSPRSWGVGDFGDLADLAAVAGRTHGADYVLVNPVHAAEPRPPVEASPYLPTSRRFANPLYIRVENIREAAYLPRKQFKLVEQYAEKFERANRRTTRIDRDAPYRAKLEVLELIHRVQRSPSRQAAFDDFRAAEGRGLADFALWCALTEKFGARTNRWAELAPHPETPYVDEQRVTLADRISFYCWLQWICDEQLAEAQVAARAAGMGIGVIHDLAVGVQRTGADAWTLGDALADGITVGAPPDDFNQQGQNWNQPPWRPDRLAELGYRPYRDMLRTVLRHAGGLRVDHVLGLFRLWWIPDGAAPDEGTYVRYDHEALVGILALEAHRAGAVIIGEDLGVFEGWVQHYLRDRGILGTSILWFERDDGVPRPPEGYRELCLTSVTTHDLPPTAGYLAGAHIKLRSELELLERDHDAELEADRRARDAVLQLARDRGLLAEDADEQSTVEALHRLVACSPSVLIGVALVDAVGEHRIQNQPGTDEEYPNWRIPLADDRGKAVSIDDLAGNERFRSLIAALRESGL